MEPSAQPASHPPPTSKNDAVIERPIESASLSDQTMTDVAVVHNPVAMVDDASRSRPPESAPAEAQEQQPSSKTVTNGTTEPAGGTENSMDQSVSDAGAGPVPYSTRTRTRGARPNYAEHHDNMDFEYTQQASKRAPSAADLKSVTTTPTNGASDHEGIKDTASGMAGKKRKSTMSTTNGIPKDAVTTSRRNGTSAILKRPATNVMHFEQSGAMLNKSGQLVADDGTTVAINDNFYLVCEPPGDPYYLCRIMEFIHANTGDRTTPVEQIRVNWFYRPRDVQRYAVDTRLVYGTMHSDICPLTSLRGKCHISHRSEIKDLDEYRKDSDHFWFNQIFDRFIRRFYEVIPCSQIINVPEKVKKALDEHWKYVAVEATKIKELTSAIKTCKRCTNYAASHDSVVCALCQNSYHMACVKPPLPKKPSRGFGWSCGPCSRAQEKKLEARNTPQYGTNDNGDDELHEEEEEEPMTAITASTRAPSPAEEGLIENPSGTQAEMTLAKMWPMRYLGIHCRVEDALQYDDRAIYPRASSRLGPRHQAVVHAWYGHAVELVKPADVKKKFIKSASHKKDGKLSKETLEALAKEREDRAKRPKWVLDEPPGYVARGEDYPNDDPRNTAQLIFKMPDVKEQPSVDEKFINNYMKEARGLGKVIKIAKFSTNLGDKALELLIEKHFDKDAALAALAKVDRGADLKEPVLTRKELNNFVEGVRLYGSEHRLVRLHMATEKPTSTIVRFYYLWKKTKEGKRVWGGYDGRKGTKKQIDPTSAAAAHAEVADVGDDSAFDHNKASAHKRSFQCKFCSTNRSSQWRRAPGVAPGQTARDSTSHADDTEEQESNHDNRDRPLLALCLRCAGLWRRYAIKWEGMEEIARVIAQNNTKGYKRRLDEELLIEFHAQEAQPKQAPDRIEGDGPRKKLKVTVSDEPRKKALPVRAPTPPPVGRKPVRRQLPCAVCKDLECAGKLPLSCTQCFLAVHRQCYGLSDNVDADSWVCAQCTNDRYPVVSTDNTCTLCPIEYSHIDMWEHPKVSHKKKTDRDREQDRLDKILLDKAKQEFSARQQELSQPLLPREPLIKTDGNNWMHVICAVFTPEVKLSKAATMERAEGTRAIPPARFEAKCKLCKKQDHGACVPCHQCHANFHVACAFEAGYTLGFDVTPVKGSRKDQVTTVNLPDESGTLTAAIWCRDHTVKSIVHPMNEVVDENGTTVLQLFVENFKQADDSLAGTARKAQLVNQSIKTHLQSAAASGMNRRASTMGHGMSGIKKSRTTAHDESVTPKESPAADVATSHRGGKRSCTNCGSDTSPMFYALPDGIKCESEGSRERSRQLYNCHHCHYKQLLPEDQHDDGNKEVVSLENMKWPPPLGHFPAIHKLQFEEEALDEERDAGAVAGSADVLDSIAGPMSKEQHILPELPSATSRKHSQSLVNGVPPRHRMGASPALGDTPFGGVLPPPMPNGGSSRGGSRASLPSTERRDNPPQASPEYTGRSPQSTYDWSQGRTPLPPLSSLASQASGQPPYMMDYRQSRERSNTASRPPSGLPEGPGLGVTSFLGHGSPGVSRQGRSSTPQGPVGLDPRLAGGASASPSLGNLLS